MQLHQLELEQIHRGLSPERNKDGFDSPIVVEKVGTKEKMYPLPQSDQAPGELRVQMTLQTASPLIRRK